MLSYNKQVIKISLSLFSTVQNIHALKWNIQNYLDPLKNPLVTFLSQPHSKEALQQKLQLKQQYLQLKEHYIRVHTFPKPFFSDPTSQDQLAR